MLSNIFLLKLPSTEKFDIYSYPNDILKNGNRDFVRKVIFSYDYEHESLNQKETQSYKHFVMDSPIPQIIDGLNVYTSCINQFEKSEDFTIENPFKMIIGLIFEKQDNPYDYKEVFEDLSNEMLNNERCKFEDEMEIENFLITLFIDIRRYGDEFVEKTPEISFKPSGIFIKVFLFGIDDVGKTSFARRIKTGEFNDNSFTPTRIFNIEHVQKQNGYLALWDMPGQRAFREKWFKGIQDSNIIIYMIDVANQLRFEESKRELWNFLNKHDSSGIPLIILGNKTDLIKKPEDGDNVIIRAKQEIMDFFELDKINDRDYFFFFISVKTNYNMNEVLKTLFNAV
ncbi:MAG: ADP-ribosylation factor-like protein [Promethearchaeota archaeon]